MTDFEQKTAVTDVKLVCLDGDLWYSKCILARESPYLAKIFTNTFVVKVNVKIDKATMAYILHYLDKNLEKTDSIALSMDARCNIYKLSYLLKLDSLRDKCADMIGKDITPAIFSMLQDYKRTHRQK